MVTTHQRASNGKAGPMDLILNQPLYLNLDFSPGCQTFALHRRVRLNGVTKCATCLIKRSFFI